MDALAIDPDEDYCTLVTCTPYGINTHRLLVRGHRVANRVVAENEDFEINPVLVAGIVAGVAALAIGIALRARARGKK